MDRKAVTNEDIAILAKSTRLNLPESRYELQAEFMNGIFQMLDSLDQIPSGETSPANIYRANWEDRNE